MNANDILEHLLSRSPGVNRDTTVDTIKAGDPNREITTVGVGWIACIENLRAAVDLGCELFITHEPTFWEHTPKEERFRTIEPGLSKQQFLDESGLVVLRCHDVWDYWPEIGIAESWWTLLGLTDPVALTPRRDHALYAIEPTTLRELARSVAEKIAPLGEDSVSVSGDPERIVSRLGIGVGAGGPGKDMIDEGADVLLVSYDGELYWNTRSRLIELGAAIICIEHGTSEMPGMVNLAKYLKEQFPQLTFHGLEKHARTWTVMGGAPRDE